MLKAHSYELSLSLSPSLFYYLKWMSSTDLLVRIFNLIFERKFDFISFLVDK